MPVLRFCGGGVIFLRCALTPYGAFKGFSSRAMRAGRNMRRRGGARPTRFWVAHHDTSFHRAGFIRFYLCGKTYGNVLIGSGYLAVEYSSPVRKKWAGNRCKLCSDHGNRLYNPTD